MSRPVLVLNPAGGAGATAWLREVLPAAGAGDCAAVLVVNNGGAESVRLLHRALELRSQRPSLPVAVLTPLDARLTGIEALVGALALSPAQAAAAMAVERLPVQAIVSDQAINFVYDV